MRRPYSRLVAAGVLAVAISALTIGPAFAGNGNGNGNGNGATQSQSGSPSQGGNGNASQPGMKPANNTAKGTSCTYQDANTCTANSPSTPQSQAKKDASKHYGNNKTAAQIAAQKGVQPNSNIYGPGNSQPHKVTCPGSTKGPDVHAYKSGKHSCATPSSPPAQQSSGCTSNCGGCTSNCGGSNTGGTPQVTPINGAAPATSNNTAPATSNNNSGVLGATTTLAKPKARAHRGVLGTTARIRGGSLPFTGFPTWLAALLGIGMILGGATLRKRTSS